MKIKQKGINIRSFTLGLVIFILIILIGIMSARADIFDDIKDMSLTALNSITFFFF